MSRYDHDETFDAAVAQKKTELLARVTEQIASDARRYAPVRTGHLRESIHAEPPEGDTAKVVADADYAIYVEMGTRHMGPQPYLRPALYSRRSI